MPTPAAVGAWAAMSAASIDASGKKELRPGTEKGRQKRPRSGRLIARGGRSGSGVAGDYPVQPRAWGRRRKNSVPWSSFEVKPTSPSR